MENFSWLASNSGFVEKPLETPAKQIKKHMEGDGYMVATQLGSKARIGYLWGLVDICRMLNICYRHL